MSNITSQDIKKEFFRSKMGIAGIIILTILILTSVVTIVTIPVETFQEWNNPGSWITYPKAATPVFIPIMFPSRLIRGPPLLPGLMDASV